MNIRLSYSLPQNTLISNPCILYNPTAMKLSRLRSACALILPPTSSNPNPSYTFSSTVSSPPPLLLRLQPPEGS